MSMDPWSVSSQATDALATQFFSASLFPYLGFLYFLSRPQTKCPPVANLGFRFLLVFVLGSIPAGLYAKTHYGDILANVDWLHGSAESLLTITNLLIVMGMRSALGTENNDVDPRKNALLYFVMTLISFAVLYAPSVGIPHHPEPINALSLPTWIIHVSSIIEWLLAMSLIYDFAQVSGNPRWRGLTWGMIPLHVSGICACTYHFFYNSPSMNLLVTLQALLTVLGNTGLLVAAYRIYGFSKKNENRRSAASSQPLADGGGETENLLKGLQESFSFPFFLELFTLSTLGAAIIKWGELLLDAPFDPSYALAYSIIVIPAGLNVVKWARASEREQS